MQIIPAGLILILIAGIVFLLIYLSNYFKDIREFLVEEYVPAYFINFRNKEKLKETISDYELVFKEILIEEYEANSISFKIKFILFLPSLYIQVLYKVLKLKKDLRKGILNESNGEIK